MYKIYLDTNMIMDIFINQAKFLRNEQEFMTPEKFKFMIKNVCKFKYVTSFITKAEIVREMISGYGLSKEETNGLWLKFVKLLD